jgi:hypothetical protein
MGGKLFRSCPELDFAVTGTLAERPSDLTSETGIRNARLSEKDDIRVCVLDIRIMENSTARIDRDLQWPDKILARNRGSDSRGRGHE